jgi:hypothetical protein
MRKQLDLDRKQGSVSSKEYGARSAQIQTAQQSYRDTSDQATAYIKQSGNISIDNDISRNPLGGLGSTIGINNNSTFQRGAPNDPTLPQNQPGAVAIPPGQPNPWANSGVYNYLKSKGFVR